MDAVFIPPLCIAKCSNRVAKVTGNNSVPILATLFFLSYGKLLRTIITALSYTKLYSSHGHKVVWSADGILDYLSLKHTPLFTVVAATLLFIWLPYTLLLFLGQWLHRCHSQWVPCFMVKKQIFISTTFVSSAVLCSVYILIVGSGVYRGNNNLLYFVD